MQLVLIWTLELVHLMLDNYITSELCKCLHPLMATGDIIDVNVQHIKYRQTSLK